MSKANSASPVSLRVSIDGAPAVEKNCDLLVVACDPRNLRMVCSFTGEEVSVFSRLTNFTFHTTLVKVKVPSSKPEFGIILNPDAIDEMGGAVSGYRNETAKQFSLETANGMVENLVTVYQLQGAAGTPWTNEQFLRNLHDTLPQLEWWPYPEFEVVHDDSGQPISLTTPYFDHFTNDGLTAKMPWHYLGVQGTGHTIYVHGSTCFESVLQCWQYGGMLLEEQQKLGWRLPSDLSASIIVLGAGPSGLLFAHRLQERGYRNVEILESSDRIGGKTHTVTLHEPSPHDSGAATACELGTCYLSPAYDKMVTALGRFLEGNCRHGFYIMKDHSDPENRSFRGMVAEGLTPGIHLSEATISYDEYVILKGQVANGEKPDPRRAKETERKIGEALGKYDVLVHQYLGSELPLPFHPPQKLLDKRYSSFYDFLERNDLLILTGLLEYSYSVQGYGPLKHIPAYYGMIWISLPLTKAILKSYKSKDATPMVTVLSKGWLALWEEMRTKVPLNVTLNTTIERIDRVI
ncbi:NAD(P)-binding protein [Aurantimonas sp. E1-2-R+4]|uniref:NAD(P)-binding protein n=1 Tax=Aurantimonas sp. E1-2-R+4 TaxID=3113714 RepID=UPI002F94DE9C